MTGHQLSLDSVGEPTVPGAEVEATDSGEHLEASRPPTAEQAAAIAARGHDAFLEAGAGTGKTTVLVERYCAAVVEDDVEVDRILAFTFTERAAAELRTRVRRELAARARAARAGGDASRGDDLMRAARATERSWVMTIHGFCRRLLAAHPLAAGLDPRFRVLDAAEATRLRDRAADLALDQLLAGGDERVAWAAAAYQPWRLTEIAVGAHERLRSRGMDEPRLPRVPEPIHSPKRNEDRRDLNDDEARAATAAREAVEQLIERFHACYRRLKEDRSALDFQDLELRALELLRSSAALGAVWRERFAHVMVDEFQDTNRVQLELVEALRGDQTRLLWVGDENQSIYRFRNADLDVFRAERRRALESRTSEVLPLRGNFRSQPAVLAGVNEVGGVLLDGFAELTAGRPPSDGAGAVELLLTLDEGSGREARKWDGYGPELDPPPGGSSSKVVAEARCLAQRLRELVDAGETRRNEIVVLLRAFTHVDAYEEALGRAGLRPFVVGGRGYWTQQQVEDLVRLLGVVANPLDDEYLFGALACFAVGASPDALWLLRRAAQDEAGRPGHVWPVLEWRFGGGSRPRECAPQWLDSMPARDVAALQRFCRILAPLRAEASLSTLEDLIERTMTAFGYDLGLIAREGGTGRMANVRKLMRLAREYERNEGRDLAGFLSLAAQSTRRDEREGMAAVQTEGHDGVRVMTVHAAKGLQFVTVAVPDLARALNAGHSHADLVIGPPPDADAGEPGFGMRLAFPSAASLGLWELVELNAQQSAAEAEEGCRLVYVAASRACDRLILSGIFKPADLEPAAELKPSDSPLRRLLPALAAKGWAGGDGELAVPGPRPVGDDSHRLDDATIRIRVSEPGPKRAAELARRVAPPEQPTPPAGEQEAPPLLAEGSAGVPVGHLSYSALALYERCGYRFYVERVLGARQAVAGGTGSPGAAEEPGDELIEPRAGRALALGVGNAVHQALEWSARNGWEQPSAAMIALLLRREGLEGDGAAADRVERLVVGWLGSQLRGQIGSAPARPEVPFVLGLGGTVVRGQIDLLIPGEEGEPATVIDYKTDALDGRDPNQLASRYRAQREVYALAAGNGAGAHVAHVFLEAPDEPVHETLDRDQLASARTRLEALIARMRDGGFEVAEEPYPALCVGCPAAQRLCPRPQWRPG